MRLTFPPLTAYNPWWSPDGKKIVFRFGCPASCRIFGWLGLVAASSVLGSERASTEVPPPDPPFCCEQQATRRKCRRWRSHGQVVKRCAGDSVRCARDGAELRSSVHWDAHFMHQGLPIPGLMCAASDRPPRDSPVPSRGRCSLLFLFPRALRSASQTQNRQPLR